MKKVYLDGRFIGYEVPERIARTQNPYYDANNYMLVELNKNESGWCTDNPNLKSYKAYWWFYKKAVKLDNLMRTE